jgi:5-methylcytosine-specific restriction endonuclease McrA
MDDSTIKLIMNQLRQGTLIWDGRKNALDKARKKVQEGFLKNGKPFYKYFWQCNVCKDWFRDSSSVEVDHIEEIGPYKGDWNDFINRMYCSEDNLQVLCSKCHVAKTTKNARERWVRK